jgi:type IV secretion system protein VirB4
MSGIFDRLGMASDRKRHRSVPGQPQPRHWSQALSENPLSRFVPFSSLLSDHDVITRGGDFLRVWRLDGVAFECADDHLISERHEALCSLLRNLSGGQWAVWTHRLHRKVQDALSDPVEEGFAKDLSQAYQAHLNQRAMMSNELYLTLVYRPNISRVSRALQSPKRSKAAIAESHADALRVMEERTAFVHRVLRGFGPQMLGGRESAGAGIIPEMAFDLGLGEPRVAVRIQ